MRNGVLAIGLVALGAGVAAPRPPAAKCRTWSDELGRQKQDADDFNAKSFARALDERKLEPLELPVEQLPQRAGLPGPIDHEGAHYYVAGDVESSYGPQPTLTFVEDAARAVYVVDRDPEPISKQRYSVCGCGPPTGGGAYMPRTIAYRLPNDRPFKGHVRVHYREKRVAIAWTEQNPDGSICAQPP